MAISRESINNILKSASSVKQNSFNRIEQENINSKYNSGNSDVNPDNIETMNFNEYMSSYGTASGGGISDNNYWKRQSNNIVSGINMNFGDSSQIAALLREGDGDLSEARKFIEDKYNKDNYAGFWNDLSDEKCEIYFCEFLGINPNNKAQAILDMLNTYPDLKEYEFTDEELWNMCWNFKLEEKNNLANSKLETKKEVSINYNSDEYSEYVLDYKKSLDEQIELYKQMLNDSSTIIKAFDENYDGTSLDKFNEVITGDFDAKTVLIVLEQQGYDIFKEFGIRMDRVKNNQYSDNYLRILVRDKVTPLLDDVETLSAAVSYFEQLKNESDYSLITNCEDFKAFEVDKKVKLKDDGTLDIYANKEENVSPVLMAEYLYDTVGYQMAKSYTGWNMSADSSHESIYHKYGSEYALMVKMSRDSNHPEYSNITKIYNFIFYTQGENAANDYIASLSDKFMQYEGEQAAIDVYSKLEKDDNGQVKIDASNYALLGLHGEYDGFHSWIQGLTGWIDHDTLYAEDYKQMYLLQMLEESNKTLQVDYNINMSIGNMLPSVALSIVNPALGNISIFLSAGGNSYRDAKLNYGASDTSAFSYAVLSGTSELLLEKLLGGLPGISDIEVTNIKTFFQSMLKEGGEEALQEWVSADARMLTGVEKWSDTDLEYAKQIFGDSVTSFVYGAATAGTMQGVGAMATSFSKTYQNILNLNSYDIKESNIPSCLEPLYKQVVEKNRVKHEKSLQKAVEATANTFESSYVNSKSNISDVNISVSTDISKSETVTNQSYLDRNIYEYVNSVIEVIDKKYKGEGIGLKWLQKYLETGQEENITRDVGLRNRLALIDKNVLKKVVDDITNIEIALDWNSYNVYSSGDTFTGLRALEQFIVFKNSKYITSVNNVNIKIPEMDNRFLKSYINRKITREFTKRLGDNYSLTINDKVYNSEALGNILKSVLDASNKIIFDIDSYALSVAFNKAQFDEKFGERIKNLKRRYDSAYDRCNKTPILYDDIYFDGFSKELMHSLRNEVNYQDVTKKIMFLIVMNLKICWL